MSTLPLDIRNIAISDKVEELSCIDLEQGIENRPVRRKMSNHCHSRSSNVVKPGYESLAPSSEPKLYTLIDYPDPYVQPLISDALNCHLHGLALEPLSSVQQLPSAASAFLQFRAYESLDFEHAMNHPKSSLICAYVIRKALIRKHYLSNTISTWLVKHPDSRLKRHFKEAVIFELDYAEFLDEALVDAWDLNASMRRNEELTSDSKNKEWWILKPGMSDGGNGIRLFSSIDQLRSIFEEWEGDEDDGSDENEVNDIVQDEPQGKSSNSAGSDGLMTSQLRHFIAQPYIDPPLLLPSRGNRKFHIRVYVLAVGALKVYVYREMLALFAAKPYQSPFELDSGDDVDLASHLTNTCFQGEAPREGSVARFWDLEDATCRSEWKDELFKEICEIIGLTFEAACREQMVHFQTSPNAFEIFGVDFLVDAGLNVWLLELNAYPDFKQTGKHLQDVIVGGLFREVVKTAITPFFSQEGNDCQTAGDMVCVRTIDLGRR